MEWHYYQAPSLTDYSLYINFTVPFISIINKTRHDLVASNEEVFRPIGP